MKESITTRCIDCGKSFTIEVDAESLRRYRAGERPLQKVLSELSKEDRELHFISHLCNDCFLSLFNEDEGAPGEYWE